MASDPSGLSDSRRADPRQDAIDNINSNFYNLGGVSSNFDYCVNFIFNIYKILFTNLTKKTKEEKKNSYEGCLTFECISSKNQLILPFYMQN